LQTAIVGMATPVAEMLFGSDKCGANEGQGSFLPAVNEQAGCRFQDVHTVAPYVLRRGRPDDLSIFAAAVDDPNCRFRSVAKGR
jgi:hypothetical protein